MTGAMRLQDRDHVPSELLLRPWRCGEDGRQLEPHCYGQCALEVGLEWLEIWDSVHAEDERAFLKDL